MTLALPDNVSTLQTCKHAHTLQTISRLKIIFSSCIAGVDRCVFLVGCKSDACGTYYAIVADERIELLESQKAQVEIDFRQELEKDYQYQLQMLTEENLAKLPLRASRQENGDVARKEVSEKGERGDHLARQITIFLACHII